MGTRASQEPQHAAAEPTTLACTGGGVLQFSGDSGALSTGDRDRMLREMRAGNVPTSLLVEAITFRQLETPNRSFVRFRPGMLHEFAKSFEGQPVLRDHAQRELAAVAGEIVTSKFEREEAGGKGVIRQTLRLVKPWAIEAALDGTMKRFSIGWNNTAPVLCTACEAPLVPTIFGPMPTCKHLPGDELDGGGFVEALVTGAEGIEVSAVTVPAVRDTGVENIRAALSAARAWVRSRSALSADPADATAPKFAVGDTVKCTVDHPPSMKAGMLCTIVEAFAGAPPYYAVEHEGEVHKWMAEDEIEAADGDEMPMAMSLRKGKSMKKLIALLSLAADADEDAVASAVVKLRADRDAAQQLAAAHETALTAARGELAKYEAADREKRIDALLGVVRAKVGQKLGADKKPERGGTPHEAAALALAEHDLPGAEKFAASLPQLTAVGGDPRGRERAALPTTPDGGELSAFHKKMAKAAGIPEAEFKKRIEAQRNGAAQEG